MNFFRFLFVAMLLSVQSIFSGEIPHREEILNYSKMELPHFGTLECGPTGLIYLDVSDDYIIESGCSVSFYF